MKSRDKNVVTVLEMYLLALTCRHQEQFLEQNCICKSKLKGKAERITLKYTHVHVIQYKQSTVPDGCLFQGAWVFWQYELFSFSVCLLHMILILLSRMPFFDGWLLFNCKPLDISPKGCSESMEIDKMQTSSPNAIGVLSQIQQNPAKLGSELSWIWGCNRVE